MRERGILPSNSILCTRLLHSLEIFAYLLLVNILFGMLIHFIGEENISAFLDSALWLQPLIASVVGLIPNCASSVLITGAFTGRLPHLRRDGRGAVRECGAGVRRALQKREALAAQPRPARRAVRDRRGGGIRNDGRDGAVRHLTGKSVRAACLRRAVRFFCRLARSDAQNFLKSIESTRFL